MKNILTLLLLLLLAACHQEEPQPSLEGSRWAAFDYSSSLDGSQVYQILTFTSETEVQRYAAREKTDILNTPVSLPYAYDHPHLSITLAGAVYTGTVGEGFIRILDKDYERL